MKFPPLEITNEEIRGLELEDGPDGDVMLQGYRFKIFEEGSGWRLRLKPGTRLPSDAPVKKLEFPTGTSLAVQDALRGYGSLLGLPYHREAETEEWLARRAPDTLPLDAGILMESGLCGWSTLLDSNYLQREGLWIKVPCLLRDGESDLMARHHHIQAKKEMRQRFWIWLMS